MYLESMSLKYILTNAHPQDVYLIAKSEISYI